MIAASIMTLLAAVVVLGWWGLVREHRSPREWTDQDRIDNWPP